mgnify:CR=1 FL=1
MSGLSRVFKWGIVHILVIEKVVFIVLNSVFDCIVLFYRDKDTSDMLVSDREVTVFSDWCTSAQCRDTCLDAVSIAFTVCPINQ